MRDVVLHELSLHSQDDKVDDERVAVRVSIVDAASVEERDLGHNGRLQSLDEGGLEVDDLPQLHGVSHWGIPAFRVQPAVDSTHLENSAVAYHGGQE